MISNVLLTQADVAHKNFLVNLVIWGKDMISISWSDNCNWSWQNMEMCIRLPKQDKLKNHQPTRRPASLQVISLCPPQKANGLANLCGYLISIW